MDRLRVYLAIFLYSLLSSFFFLFKWNLFQTKSREHFHSFLHFEKCKLKISLNQTTRRHKLMGVNVKKLTYSLFVFPIESENHLLSTGIYHLLHLLKIWTFYNGVFPYRKMILYLSVFIRENLNYNFKERLAEPAFENNN